jgi:hypothetical protein
MNRHMPHTGGPCLFGQFFHLASGGKGDDFYMLRKFGRHPQG